MSYKVNDVIVVSHPADVLKLCRALSAATTTYRIMEITTKTADIVEDVFDISPDKAEAALNGNDAFTAKNIAEFSWMSGYAVLRSSLAEGFFNASRSAHMNVCIIIEEMYPELEDWEYSTSTNADEGTLSIRLDRLISEENKKCAKQLMAEMLERKAARAENRDRFTVESASSVNELKDVLERLVSTLH